MKANNIPYFQRDDISTGTDTTVSAYFSTFALILIGYGRYALTYKMKE